MPGPLISHITTRLSLLLRHSRSTLPSALKSPRHSIFHSVGAPFTFCPALIVLPFMNQRTFSPVEKLRHRMSERPSLLTSLGTEDWLGTRRKVPEATSPRNRLVPS